MFCFYNFLSLFMYLFSFSFRHSLFEYLYSTSSAATQRHNSYCIIRLTNFITSLLICMEKFIKLLDFFVVLCVSWNICQNNYYRKVISELCYVSRCHLLNNLEWPILIFICHVNFVLVFPYCSILMVIRLLPRLLK